MQLLALPDEVLRSQILKAHVVGDSFPTPFLLMLRGICRRFWKAIPVWDLLSLREDTAKWLLGGETEEWGSEKNTPDLRVLPILNADAFDKTCEIEVMSMDKAVDCDKKLNSCVLFTFVEKGELFVKVSIRGKDHIALELTKNQLKSGEKFNFVFDPSSYMGTYSVAGMVYVMTETGELFKFDPLIKLNQPRTVPLVDKVRDRVQEFEIQDGHIRSLTCFKVLDDTDVWMLDYRKHLFHLNVHDPKSMTLITENVNMFCVLEKHAIYMTSTGRLRMQIRRGQRRFTIALLAQKIYTFTVSPSTKSLWFRDPNGQIHRRGTPIEHAPQRAVIPAAPVRQPLDVPQLQFTGTILVAALAELGREMEAFKREMVNL